MATLTLTVGLRHSLKELSERWVERGYSITIYCHKNLFDNYPAQVNGINLVCVPTIERKNLSQFVHSFFSMIHACVKSYDLILVVNAANGSFGLISRIFRIPTAINVDGLEWLRPKWEGLGRRYFHGHEFGGTNPTLLKALAYGTAILALETPFSRETLGGDKHGKYFTKEPGNLCALINDESFRDKFVRMKTTAQDRINERYTWEMITDAYEQLINNLVGKS